jgi:CHAT domain-containing protein
LRLKEKYQHPYFWGAFALNGALTAEEIRS